MCICIAYKSALRINDKKHGFHTMNPNLKTKPTGGFVEGKHVDVTIRQICDLMEHRLRSHKDWCKGRITKTAKMLPDSISLGGEDPYGIVPRDLPRRGYFFS